MKKFVLLLLFSIFCSAQEYFMVFFESDQHVLSAEQTSKLTAWVAAHQKDKVIAIEGYTDADGSIAYNDTLAKKRVNQVLNLIKNNIQVREDFRTRSYGKLHEQFDDKSKNRRVTITYIPQKDLAKEEEILGLSPKPTPPKPPKITFPDVFALKGPRGEEILLELDQTFMQSLNEATAGSKLIIKGLNFHFNTFAITNESRPKLYELLLVMNANPNLNIEIRGHMCCNPSQRPDKLSAERAKSVKLFLMQNGIHPNRVNYQGMGTSEPIFKIPEANEEQRAANRRVEIFVVKNN